MKINREQIQSLRDGISLSDIARRKLESFILPEADKLSPQAQEQLREVHQALKLAKGKFCPEVSLPPR